MKKMYIPDRNDLIWLDFEPKKGNEIGKYRPALVLSHKKWNEDSDQLICCPISTSIRGHCMEVPVNNLEQPSVVIPNIIRTVSWRMRHAKFIAVAEEGVLINVLKRIIPLIGAEKLFE